MALFLSGLQENVIVISKDVIWLVFLFAVFILMTFLIYHLIRLFQQVRATLQKVDDFLLQSEDILRNLKSISYKVDLQLDDTGVITSSLRKSVEELSNTVSAMSKVTSRPFSWLFTLLGPVLWLRKRKKKS